VLCIALGATFGTFFLTAFRVTNRAREVRVPDVQGMTLAAATAALAETGLIVKVESRRPDPKVPPDHVLAQEPEPGAVLRRQRSVRLRVSDGQRAPIVPSVVGQAERTAEIVLAQAQVTIADRAEIRDGEFPAGAVIAQDPVEKQRAGQVNLLVNRGPGSQTFVMPDLIGTPSSRVVEMLRRRGFRVSVAADVPYPGIPAGTVVRQRPQAGFQIESGDPVVLEVSR
jgi:beta-lactam-binding protein with PASTA domain